MDIEDIIPFTKYQHTNDDILPLVSDLIDKYGPKNESYNTLEDVLNNINSFINEIELSFITKCCINHRFNSCFTRINGNIKWKRINNMVSKVWIRRIYGRCIKFNDWIYNCFFYL